MDTTRILMIKDMASVVFTEPQDTIVLRKYLTEMENLYRKSPHVSRIYLYSTKKEYATLKVTLIYYLPIWILVQNIIRTLTT